MRGKMVDTIGTMLGLMLLAAFFPLLVVMALPLRAIFGALEWLVDLEENP